MNRGFDYLDAHNYDQGIAYFEDLLKQDPHPQVRMALASAYAARAGIKIENIYNFIAVKHEPQMRLQLSGLNFSEQTNETVKSLEAFLAQWEQVPNVSKDGRLDLDKAVKILSETDNSGARLYSAMLRVVVLKRNVGDGVQQWDLRFNSTSKKICTKDIQPWWDWAERVFGVLDKLGTDIELAFPKKQEELRQYREQLDDVKIQMKQVKIPKGEQCF
ncbi:hypothetical protein [Bdellovibrio sp. HCB209]|uniref:hypothetical protein n=1 Tax=Bdellovibrio sp. HCB209 TaxID=3394354 RepID=UPI0039B64343